VKIGICEEKVVRGHEEIKVGRGEEMEYKKRGRKSKSNKRVGKYLEKNSHRKKIQSPERPVARGL
jgi:hypothetical protein